MTQLIARKVALLGCTLGVIEVLIGTALSVCGFINLGAYYEKSGIGMWAGLPLIVPGLLGIVVLATRHRTSSLFFMITNLAVLAICIAHSVVVHDEIDFWDRFKDYHNAGNCFVAVDISLGTDLCKCTSESQNEYVVRRCELFEMGHELFWGMFGISIAGIVFSFFGFISGALGAFLPGVKEDYDPPPRQSNDSRRRYDYYVD